MATADHKEDLLLVQPTSKSAVDTSSLPNSLLTNHVKPVKTETFAAENAPQESSVLDLSGKKDHGVYLTKVTASDDSKSNAYKICHPIGSRKVTENIITYHEPMFQSVANDLFENKKNLVMGKRKAEDDKEKSDLTECKKNKFGSCQNGSEIKKIKLDMERCEMPLVKGRGKRKDSIEHVIERIRTEKTQSRGNSFGQGPKISESCQQKVKMDTVDDSIIQNIYASNYDVCTATKNSIKSEQMPVENGSHNTIQENTLTNNQDNFQQGNINEVGKSVQEHFDKQLVNIMMQEINMFTDVDIDVLNENVEKTPTRILESKVATPFTFSQNKSVCSASNKIEKEHLSDKELHKTYQVKKQTEDLILESRDICNADCNIGNKEYVKKKKGVKLRHNADTERIFKVDSLSSEAPSVGVGSTNKINTAILENNEPSVTKPTIKKAQKPIYKHNISKAEKVIVTQKRSTTNITNKLALSLEDPKIKKKEKSCSKCNSDSYLDTNITKKVRKKAKSEPDSDKDICGSIGKRKAQKPDKTIVGDDEIFINDHTVNKQSRKKKVPVDNDSYLVATKNCLTAKSSNGFLERLTKLKKKVCNQKPKIPITVRRTKREASLNASLFVNILCEKSKRTSKLSTKRSKSDSDISQRQVQNIFPCLSLSQLNIKDTSTDAQTTELVISPKIEQRNSTKQHNVKATDFDAVKNVGGLKDTLQPQMEPFQSSKTPSPRRKVSFNDDIFDDVFQSVIQRSIQDTVKGKDNNDSKKIFKFGTLSKIQDKKFGQQIEQKLFSKTSGLCGKMQSEKSDKCKLSRIKNATQQSVSKSPEEIAEKKRKASLARLQKAKELLKTKNEFCERINSVSNTSSDLDPFDSSDDEVTIIEDVVEDKKVKSKKNVLLRSARTHVSVEAKTAFENTIISPIWCEHCQSSYYPSQPTHGTQKWQIKQLVDTGSSDSPKPIQSSSHHFIAAHANLAAGPYASPTRISVLDSSPYVAGQLVPHSHLSCSPCGHGGVYHTTQCQNYALSGVGNLLKCQHYGGTYTVPYTHGSYAHCACGACPGSTYHHTVAQTLLHTSQIPIATESSILVHHPAVQLQVTHDATHSVPLAQLQVSLEPHHSVAMPTLAHSHSDSALAHSVPVQLSHGSNSFQHLSHMCELSQGEVTNVSVMRSNSQSDHELVDVGNKDDILRTIQGHLQTLANSDKLENVKHSALEKIKEKERASQENCVSKRKSKSSDSDKEQNKQSQKGKYETLKVKDKAKKLKPGKIKNIMEKKSDKDTKSQDLFERTTKLEKDIVRQKKLKKLKLSKSEKSASIQEAEVNETHHGWRWKGKGMQKTCVDIVDDKPKRTEPRKCYSTIVHENGDVIHIKDCVLVCSDQKDTDIPYVAKVTGFWEHPTSGEMMMTILWYYQPEHTDAGRKPEHIDNEVFAAKHWGVASVACIEDRVYVLTYNEYCRFRAEVERLKLNLPARKKVVPDAEKPDPSNRRIPPLDVDPENVFLCRQVFDCKLKRVLKKPRCKLYPS